MKLSVGSELAVYLLMIAGLVAFMAVPAYVANYYSLSGLEMAIVVCSVCAGLRAYVTRWWPLPDSRRQLFLRLARRSALVFFGIQCIKLLWASNAV